MSTEVRHVTVTPAQDRYRSWAVDVLVYTVVLNLFVEYNSAIIIDSFTISIFTAALLKVMLDVLTFAEHKASKFFGRINKWLGYLAMWLVLFLSKFVILEVVDIVFGEHVELGKFLDIVFLILTMMVVRAVVTEIYLRLGDGSASRPAP